MDNFNLKGGAGKPPQGQIPPPPQGASPADRAVKAKAKKEKPMKQPKEPGAKGGNKSTLILLAILGVVALGGGAFFILSMNKNDTPEVYTPPRRKRPPLAGKVKPGDKRAATAPGEATNTETVALPGDDIEAAPGKTAKGKHESEIVTSAELEKQAGKNKKESKKAEAPKVEKAKTEAPKAEKPAPVAAAKPKAYKPRKASTPSVVIAQSPSFDSYVPRPKYKRTSTSYAPKKKKKSTAAKKPSFNNGMIPAVAWNERGAMAIPKIPGRNTPPPISKPAPYGLSGYADVYSWSPSGMPNTPPPLRTYPTANEFKGPGRPSAPGAGFSKMTEYSKVIVVETSDPGEVQRVKRSLTRHNLIPEVMSHEVGGTTYYELSVGHYTSKAMAANKANEIAAQGFPARVVSEKVYH